MYSAFSMFKVNRKPWPTPAYKRNRRLWGNQRLIFFINPYIHHVRKNKDSEFQKGLSLKGEVKAVFCHLPVSVDLSVCSCL